MNVTKVPTRHGDMWTVDSDVWVSRALRELGEYSEGEVNLLRQVLDRLPQPDGGHVIVDAGAYIGDMTVPLSRLSGVGHVVAFEPQPEIREILESNLDENDCENVTVLPYALGCENVPIHFSNPDPVSPGSQQMSPVPLPPGAEGTVVEMKTLDSLDLHPSIIKADIEGMELLMLLGAQETLARSRPVLFLERDTVRIEGAPDWDDIMRMLQYVGYNVDIPIFSPTNFNGTSVDPFGGIVSRMMLCVPLVPMFSVTLV